eukprot:CAMPEP_0113644794 /NCGR_PEP_ID=MMETSP0017_2-20120614/23583_1 /TAXON_ID=2856 /ORGANISM="Cylindrotheca closterium" /LENGTH=226 /DNA_ID=CAMNT_0000556439 /DNA_START=166 /DNA_END=843 /DNA_ORIENTATION=+ /assembly_acc=CAM_ASM_000147
MATTIRPNPKPGKLSSKFGSAFAAFESKSGESNVPQAFRSATRKTKPTTGGQSNSTTGNNKSTPASSSTPVKRNFRVPSKLSNRVVASESSNSSGTALPTNGGSTAFKNVRQGLRKVKTPAATTNNSKSSSEPAPNAESQPCHDNEDIITEVVEEEDDDGSESSCYGYIDFVIKDTAHSTIGCGAYSDGEYEEFWEEETLDSTEEAEDWSYQSWEEETIEDEVLLE